jgi:hypothetical protein
MTLPTDPTQSGGGGPRPVLPTGHPPSDSALAAIRELLSVMRDLIDRLEDRINHLGKS